MVPPLPDQLLRVDLSTGSVTSEAIPERRLRAFLGGKGLGARYLYEAVGPSVGPLDPANALLLMVGPLTGYLPGDGRFAAITKSPLTGLFLDSYAGGSFGPSLRGAMPDHAGIMITGRADEISVLNLRDDSRALIEAPELRGKPVDEVDSAFPDASVVTIGPAGEAEVAFATIATDGGDHHAGRGGSGAVLGAKRLKAVVVPDSEPLESTSEIEELRALATDRFQDSAYGRSYLAGGTLETVDIADELSILPTRGWREREFEGTSEIGIEAAQSAAIERERPADPFPGDYRFDTGQDGTVMRGGTPIALGATLGIDDFESVTRLASACDRFGLDVISTGNVIALAMLASEAGNLDREIAFADVDAAHDVIEEIATRSTPLGTTLADGVDDAADRLELSGEIPTVKQMAVPSFDPRGVPAMALAFATSDRGACHRRAVPATVDAFEPGWTPSQTAHAMRIEQNRRAALWCLIVDDVATPLFEDLGATWLSALGHSIDRRELQQIGRRTWTLTRLFNVREGVNRADDSLPEVFRRPDESGSTGLEQATFDRTLDRYYELREWDRQGRPSQRLIERLDLEAVVDEETPIGDPPLHPDGHQLATRTGDGE